MRLHSDARAVDNTQDLNFERVGHLHKRIIIMSGQKLSIRKIKQIIIYKI